MAFRTVTSWPSGWRYAPTQEAKWTYSADVPSGGISATAPGQFCRNYRSTSDNSAAPAVTDVGIKLSDIPTDGSAKFRMKGVVTSASAGTPAPRFAGFNRTTNTGHAPSGTTTVFGWPSLGPGEYDVEVAITESALQAARTAFGEGDVEVFFVFGIPQGTLREVSFGWEVTDPTPTASGDGFELTVWDDGKEKPAYVAGISETALRNQSAPFQTVPSLRNLISTSATSPVRVVAFGDSQVQGNTVGNSTGSDGWVNQLAVRCGSTGAIKRTADAAGPDTTVSASSTGVTIVNCGFGGSTSATFAPANALNMAKKFDPHLYLVSVGTNDCLTGVSVSQYKTNLSNVVQAMLTNSPNTRIVLLTSWANASMDAKWSEYCEAMREIAMSDKRVFFADTAALYRSIGINRTDYLGVYQSDKLHFNRTGHTFHADLVGDLFGIPHQSVRPSEPVVIGVNDNPPEGTPAGTLIIKVP